MITVLATKSRSLWQKERLLHAKIGVVSYDAIQIDFLPYAYKGSIKNAIFTSQNAVRSVFRDQKSTISNCFCVGEKTKALLEENGQKVIKMAQNASELAKFVVKNYKNEVFTFFHGNLKRAELPLALEENNISFNSVEVYRTTLVPKRFNRTFNGILFFSPSAVQSFMLENSMQDQIAFCIGNTTAEALKKHTNSICIANKPTIENTIVQVIKYYTSDIVR